MTNERQMQWDTLAREVDALGGSGADFVSAMQEFYTIYSDRVIEWYAGLYDYRGGGFYFATSGRDTDGYLPDIEATSHSLGFFEKFEGVSNYRDVTPAWMREQTCRWIKGLQDPNGYFYHPQWTRELIDEKLTRKGRDLNYGMGVLRTFGTAPTYDTPLGDRGDGLRPDGTPIAEIPACAACGGEEKPAVSTVVYPEHLESAANFRRYLHSHLETVQKKPYVMGNLIANQISQIKVRDKILRAAGETESLCQMLIDWFGAHQNPETGNWYHFDPEDEGNERRIAYEGNNSLLKIIDVYNQIGAELPHPIEAARSAMRAIASSVYPETVCDMYNTWFAVSMVITNIRKFSSLPEEEKEAYITLIRRELLRDAPECIRAMKDKMLRFRRADHAFSYTPRGTSITSQGVPVAVPGYDEGDTNASCIVIGGCNSHIYGALGLTRIKPFEAPLLDEYLALLEENHRKSI